MSLSGPTGRSHEADHHPGACSQPRESGRDPEEVSGWPGCYTESGSPRSPILRKDLNAEELVGVTDVSGITINAGIGGTRSPSGSSLTGVHHLEIDPEPEC